jgi:hypothetical protein
MAIVQQFTVTLANRPGTLAELCSELAKKAVNIHALEGASTGSAAAIRLVVGRVEAARKVLQAQGLRFTEEQVLAVRVADRPGSLGKVMRKLAEKGINVEYAYGSIARGETQAMIVLGVSDVQAAATVAR